MHLVLIDSARRFIVMRSVDLLLRNFVHADAQCLERNRLGSPAGKRGRLRSSQIFERWLCHADARQVSDLTLATLFLQWSPTSPFAVRDRQ